MSLPPAGVLPYAPVSLDDPATWLTQLRTQGYTLLTNVASKDEVDTAMDLVWKWLEGLGSRIDRNDSNTWTNDNWPGPTKVAISCENK